MSHVEQLTDSIPNTGHCFWTELFFPLGLRYHALQHLFTGIPYHNPAGAHRRPIATLPADAPYRRTIFSSHWAAAGTLVRSARRRGRHAGPSAHP